MAATWKDSTKQQPCACGGAKVEVGRVWQRTKHPLDDSGLVWEMENSSYERGLKGILRNFDL
jgi:hypothetical protein